MMKKRKFLVGDFVELSDPNSYEAKVILRNGIDPVGEVVGYVNNSDSHFNGWVAVRFDGERRALHCCSALAKPLDSPCGRYIEEKNLNKVESFFVDQDEFVALLESF